MGLHGASQQREERGAREEGEKTSIGHCTAAK